ncbi:MAG: molecular chaperone HtpG [Chitinophagaceae bacterium]|nr:molecular chaperone HtpG [Chitinophagaceae bacterium]
MQKGSIRVQTENIFPIIKKFLYSDHEIFIRELVSNAVDATQKIKTLSSIGEAKGELGDLRIDITLDAEKKTLTISDRGIGMTADEIDKYLNQVAFSGAEEFLEKYKGQNENNIIGHFGLGFYSSFMVSDQVEVFSKSFKEDAKAVRWECDGSPEFTLEEVEKVQRGTDIVLHINDESKEFLEAHRIEAMLQKFCRFLPVPIYFKDVNEKPAEVKVEQSETPTEEGKEEIAPAETSINNPFPAWTKKPSELTDEDYKNFYRELYPYSEPPLFWIHLNVDYPFNLTGILYFPKIKQSYEIQKDKIHLYSNQVFVTDEVKDIVPEFLMLLHGVIDSPDIPLNVSRSYLQGDPNVRKINSHITKKVADKLEEIFKSDRKQFEEKWESLGLFVKYGMMTDDKFLEKANKFHIFQDALKDKFYTLDEYKLAIETLQKNKEGKLVILYTTNPVQQDAYIQQAVAKGYKVVRMETIVDAGFLNHMEMKWDAVQFTRVDSDIADNLIDKQDASESVLSKEDETKLKELFGLQIPELNVTVEVKGLSADAPPVVATRPEFMRRMKDMAALQGGMGAFYANMPDEVTLTVNGNHAIYKNVLTTSEKEKQEKVVHNLADLALLSQGLLKGNSLTNFINRSVELMGK